ncbi:MAG: MFS transporter [Alphaproteobacteria bacterium]|nr:MFS transporter [Alphaproteobacteria bacterium]
MFEALKGWSSTQKHVVAASYLGWTLDAFDFLLITLVAKDIAAEFHTNAKALGLIITLTLFMRPLGAFIFGRLADRFGRRPVLMADVAAYSLIAFASAFAPNLTVFLTLRCLFGVAMGGEWGIGASLAMEHVKPGARGFVSGLLQTGYPSGGLIAGVVTAFLLPEFGWRYCVMASVLPSLLVLYIRRNVPESPSFQTQRAPTDNTFAIIKSHWGIALFAVLLMTGFNTLSHGSQDFYPNFLRIQMHIEPRLASIIASIGSFGAIIGGLTFGSLSQSIGRRRAIAISAVLVLPMIYFWAFFSVNPMVLAAMAFILQFFVQGAWGVIPAHLNELSPSDARATFPGFVYQLGNLFAANIVLVQGVLVEDHGWTYAEVLALMTGAAALLISALIFFGPEARHIDMNEAGPAHE